MKIFFVENRHKTSLWEKIGEEYIKLGHEVHFIVQNHNFTPRNLNFKIHKLAYPKSNKEDVSPDNFQKYRKVILSNRGLNYFGIQYSGFIEYYGRLVNEVISKYIPDLVFGESTLFHELLIIDACKEQKILYLNPSSSRYPKNRFAFYLYDTLETYLGSNEVLPTEAATELGVSIGKRESLPDYMNVETQNISRLNKLIDKFRLTSAYFLGEKYNTPSPYNKLKINYITKKSLKLWDKLANQINTSDFNILYPLQMQPEANIDVWGFPYNNQLEIIQWIIDQLKEGQRLILKANPKSKYEISNELIDTIRLNPSKVTVLEHHTRMSDIWDDIDFVITVTGTISIECILDNKPIAMFGWGIQTEQKNCIQINFKSLLQSIISEINNNTYLKLNRKEKGQFINILLSNSYLGINGDGMHNRFVLLDPVNMKNIIDSYKSILKDVN